MASTSFSDSWGFPSEVRDSIEGAVSWTVSGTGQRFRTGRIKLACRFYDREQRLVATRDAMALTSKKTGRPYHVVSRRGYAPYNQRLRSVGVPQRDSALVAFEAAPVGGPPHQASADSDEPPRGRGFAALGIDDVYGAGHPLAEGAHCASAGCRSRLTPGKAPA